MFIQCSVLCTHFSDLYKCIIIVWYREHSNMYEVGSDVFFFYLKLSKAILQLSGCASTSGSWWLFSFSNCKTAASTTGSPGHVVCSFTVLAEGLGSGSVLSTIYKQYVALTDQPASWQFGSVLGGSSALLLVQQKSLTLKRYVFCVSFFARKTQYFFYPHVFCILWEAIDASISFCFALNDLNTEWSWHPVFWVLLQHHTQRGWQRSSWRRDSGYTCSFQ